MIYDLEGRTSDFAKNILMLLSRIARTESNKNVCFQLSKSATSVGANYREANNAASRNDFTYKIFICRKETEESKYWIEILAVVNSEHTKRLRELWSEAHQLAKIFNKITGTIRKKDNQLKTGN